MSKVGLLGVEATEKKSEGLQNVSDLAGASVDQVLGTVGDLYEVCESLSSLAVFGAQEALPSSSLSALMLATSLASNETGLFFPSSLPLSSADEALESLLGECSVLTSLAATVLNCGGEIVQGEIKSLLGEGNVVTGVEVTEPSSSASSSLSSSSRELLATRGVISGLGAITTFTKLMPGQPLSSTTATSLRKLQATRPKIKVLFWLKGQVSSLGLTSIDYLEISHSRGVDASAYAASSCRMWSPSAKDAGWRRSEVQTIVVEFEADDSIVRLKSTSLTVEGQVNHVLSC